MTRRTFTKPLLLAVASLLLVALAWGLFRQTGDFEFLRLDDHDYTYRCAFVKDGLSWANVREAFTNVRHGGIWMPATYISYMCGISLFGPSAGAHHLVNVGIHALNAVLLLWLLVALLKAATSAAAPACCCTLAVFPGSRGRSPSPSAALAVAFLLTAFWALHPQRVEAVAWIASRKELLCTTFALGGLLCWLRARRREGWGWIPALAGTYACYVLACMSKPTAMCFPFLVLAVEGIIWSRTVTTGVSPVEDRTETRSPSLSFVLCHLSFFLLIAGAVGALAVYSQTHPEGHDVRALYSAPLGWRLLNAAVSVGLYIFQMFIPVGIHLDYRAVPGGWPVQGALGLGVLAVVALAIGGAWFWCRRIRRQAGQDQALNRSWLLCIGASCLWFLASLAPTLGIFGSFGEHARADRFLYLPAMALPIAVMVLWGWFGRDKRDRSRICLAGLALVVAVFFAVAYPVVASYRNDMTAFRHTIEADPDNWRALAHVGEAECAEGNLDDGIDKLRRSREVLPRDATDAKLAYALMSRGRAEDWDEILDVCASLASDADPARRDPRGQALEALGAAELKKRRWTDAINHLVLSIRAPARHYSPSDAILKLAYALHNGGRRDEALEMFKWIKDHSGRADLARRAQEALFAVELSPRGLLFW